MRFAKLRRSRSVWPARARRHSLPLIAAALVLLSGLGFTAPQPVDAQAPVPPRPLILIGGTFVHQGFQGYCDPTSGRCVPGWDSTVRFLEDNGGYRQGTNLFIGEMAHQVDRPPGWDDIPWEEEDPAEDDRLTWDEFRAAVAATGASTAGLARAQSSVDYVIAQINFVRAFCGCPQVDIAAHSQGGVIARAAVRQLAAAGDDAVARLVTLGTPHYGASANSVIFDPNVSPLVDAFAMYAIERCRESDLLPMCRDIFLEPPSSTNFPVTFTPIGTDNENPVINPPNPPRYDPDRCVRDIIGWPPAPPDQCAPSLPFRFHTGHNFIPNLNASGGVGPVPSGTTFYNLYSRDHDGGGVSPTERLILEQLRLFPGRPNVHNWNYQDVVQCSTGLPNYPLHHNDEWADPAGRILLAEALDIPQPLLPIPPGCLP